MPLDPGEAHACSVGQGPVTVVLAAGAGQTSRTWDALVPRLSSSARVVSFDRPGLGRSPAGSSPRTPTRIARELHAVLRGLDVDGPLLLVGHSMGGLHVLRYATMHPDDVAAVVLLDTPPAGFEERRLALLTPVEQEERRRVLADGLANASEPVRLEREGAADPSEWEFPAFPASVSLTVIVADSQDFGDPGSQAAHRSLWLEGSREWLDLSRDSRLIVAEGSGHMIHHDRPGIVESRILTLIATLRR